MQIIKKTTTLEKLTFNVYLTQNLKNLGLSVDVSEDLTTMTQTKQLSFIGEANLKAIRSFDYQTPYIVGVNGVTAVSETEVTYVIDNIEYVTNLSTNVTNKSIKYSEDVFVKNNFIRTDDSIGLIEKPVYDSVVIERTETGIIESFGKLQQIRNVDEFGSFGNEFYDIFDQTF